MKEKLIIEDFKYFGGKHCWTTALKNLFSYHGLHLSEEMIFGLGSGPGFIYWYMKRMPSPFIGTRFAKLDSLKKTCKRIGAEASIFQTSSIKKGYEELKKMLRKGEPAFVLVDMAYLHYLALPGEAHFGWNEEIGRSSTQWPKQFKGLNLFGCLINTFIYIEVSGTGGGGFRPMYA